MNTKSPKVGIGLPVYNGAEFLAAAIDSLLAQSFEDFELTNSDNGSNDTTEEICREFACCDSRIRYLRYSENRGAYWNFNNVCRASRGEYFRWAAHDDLCDVDLLQHCVKVLDDDETVVWTQGTQVFVGPDGDRLSPDGKLVTLKERCRSSKPRIRFEEVLLGGSCSLDIFALMRRETLQRTRLLLPYYGSEKVLLGEMSLSGRHFQIPDARFLQRVHPHTSGNLKTAAEQQKWCDPKRATRFASPRLRLLRGHVGSVMRHPLSPTDRFGCFLAISKYLLQYRKWKKVAISILGRKGVGGGHLKQASHMNHN
jgi:glycosyltransferase involved in cell wall biosynthesis